jgi:acyl-CoA synthetase (AMP-forming)/AMP-acid ligase II
MSEPDHAIDLTERIREVLSIDSAAPAIEFEDDWYSYGEIRQFIEKLSADLATICPAEGTAVGILLRNRPAHFAAALAAIISRHCVVTINPQLPPEPLREDIQSVAAPVLIADERDWESPVIREVAEQTRCVGFSIASVGGRLRLRRVGGPELAPMQPYRAAMPGIAIEMLSSGTTGKPKRIKLARRSLSQSLYTAAKAESRNPNTIELRTSVQLQWLPLAHISGIWNAMYALYNGRRISLLERFDVDQWHRLLVRHRPKFANFPPSALRMVMDRNFPKEDFSSLIAIRTGTAPLDPELAVAFEQRYAIPVLQAYGATEFAGGVAGWTLADYRKYGDSKRGSVGRANAGVEMRIVDDASFEPLPPGQHGLLEVRTKQIEDGLKWVRTTDLASIDAEGFLYIHGRADNALIRGGFKVFPEHVEAALRTHPAIYDASVVALPDARLGQVPAAALQLQPSAAQPSEESLQQFLRERLKAYELPVAYAFVGNLPRTPSMKVSQPAVRALFTQRPD